MIGYVIENLTVHKRLSRRRPKWFYEETCRVNKYRYTGFWFTWQYRDIIIVEWLEEPSLHTLPALGLCQEC